MSFVATAIFCWLICVLFAIILLLFLFKVFKQSWPELSDLQFEKRMRIFTFFSNFFFSSNSRSALRTYSCFLYLICFHLYFHSSIKYKLFVELWADFLSQSVLISCVYYRKFTNAFFQESRRRLNENCAVELPQIPWNIADN